MSIRVKEKKEIMGKLSIFQAVQAFKFSVPYELDFLCFISLTDFY